MNQLTEKEKAYYADHHDIDVKFMFHVEVEEFLYWVNRGIDPRGTKKLSSYPWSEDDLVDVAFSIFFTDSRPLVDAIDYLDENIR